MGMVLGVAVCIAVLLGIGMICTAETDIEPTEFRLSEWEMDEHPTAGDPIFFYLNITNNGRDIIDRNFTINMSANDTAVEGNWNEILTYEYPAKEFPINGKDLGENWVELLGELMWFSEEGDAGYRKINIWLDEEDNTTDDDTDNNNITLFLNLYNAGPDPLVDEFNMEGLRYNITDPFRPICSASEYNLTLIMPWIDNWGQEGNCAVEFYYEKDGEPKELIFRFPEEGEMPIFPNAKMEWMGLWLVKERHNGTGKIIIEVIGTDDVNLSNNYMEFPIEVIFAKDPYIKNIDIDNTNPAEGEVVNITVDVANNGIVNITQEFDPFVWVTLYYQKGVKKEIGRQFISTLNNESYGPVVSKKFTWTPEIGDDGVGEIWAEIGFLNQDDNSNDASDRLDVTVKKGLPDFRVEDRSGMISRSTIGIGDSLTLSCNIENIGSTWDGSSDIKVEFYADDANDPITDDIILESVNIAGLINTGENKTAEKTISWPASLDIGNDYYILIKVDPDDDIVEKMEDNNDYNLSEIIEVVELRPNLVFFPNEIVLTYDTIGDRPYQAENITISVTVENRGNDVAGAFDVEIFIDDVSIKKERIASLNQDVPKLITTYWIAKEKGTHIFRVEIDENDEVVEWLEDDNTVSKQITVEETRIELSVEEITIDNDSPNVGDIIEITTKIMNIQSTEDLPAIMVDVTFYKNSVDSNNIIDNVIIPEIKNGESEEISINWEVEIGTMYIWVEVDTDYANLFMELGEGFNNSTEISISEFANFEINDVVVKNSTEIYEEQEVEITISVLNSGSGPGDARIILDINNEEISATIKNILVGNENIKEGTLGWEAATIGQYDYNVTVYWDDDPDPEIPPVPHDIFNSVEPIDVKEGDGDPSKQLKINSISISPELPDEGDKVKITANFNIPDNINEADLKVIFEYKLGEGEWKQIGDEVNIKNSNSTTEYTFNTAGDYKLKATIKGEDVEYERTVIVSEPIKPGDEDENSSLLLIIIIGVVCVIICVGVVVIKKGGGTPPPQGPQGPPQGLPPQGPPQQPQQPQVKQVRVPKKPM